MNWDEILLFASSVIMLFAILRRIVLTMARRNRLEHESLWMMLKATLAQFRADGLRGDEMILMALLIPGIILTVYYFLLVLPLPAFENDVTLRQGIVRSSIFTSNVVLAIYFLNGRLTRIVRRLIEWKRKSHSS
jgi:hypothetical protein